VILPQVIRHTLRWAALMLRLCSALDINLSDVNMISENYSEMASELIPDECSQRDRFISDFLAEHSDDEPGDLLTLLPPVVEFLCAIFGSEVG